MESTVTVRGSCAKRVQREPPFLLPTTSLRQKYRHAERESLPFILQFGGVPQNGNFSRSRRVRGSRGPGHEGLQPQLTFSRRKLVKSTSSGPEVSMDLQVQFERCGATSPSTLDHLMLLRGSYPWSDGVDMGGVHRGACTAAHRCIDYTLNGFSGCS